MSRAACGHSVADRPRIRERDTQAQRRGVLSAHEALAAAKVAAGAVQARGLASAAGSGSDEEPPQATDAELPLGPPAADVSIAGVTAWRKSGGGGASGPLGRAFAGKRLPRESQQRHLGRGMVRELRSQLAERLEREGSVLRDPSTEHVLRVLRVGFGAEATASERVLGDLLATRGWEAVRPVWEALDDLIEVAQAQRKLARDAGDDEGLTFEALATQVHLHRRVPACG